MSERLEAGSKLFRTPLNMSHWFVELLSPAAQKFVRIVDRIKCEGWPMPITVYTFDVSNILKDFGTPSFDEFGEQMPVDFENDPSYRQLQEGIPDDFFTTYYSAVRLYIKGQWRPAKIQFEAALKMKPEDGPTEALMDFMRETNFQAPINWPGYRDHEQF